MAATGKTPVLVDNRAGFLGNYERYTPLNYPDPDNGRLLSLTNEALLDCAGGKPNGTARATCARALCASFTKSLTMAWPHLDTGAPGNPPPAI